MLLGSKYILQEFMFSVHLLSLVKVVCLWKKKPEKITKFWKQGVSFYNAHLHYVTFSLLAKKVGLLYSLVVMAQILYVPARNLAQAIYEQTTTHFQQSYVRSKDRFEKKKSRQT